MAQDNFPACLNVSLKWEGGWSDHPADPGGATMKGVTLATYRKFKPGATKNDLRNISDAELQRIYRTGYWDTIGGDALARGLDCATFDASVNSGPARARAWHAKARAASGVVIEQIKALCSVRLGFVQGLRTWSVFGKGWARRIGAVEAVSIMMAAGSSASEELTKAAKEAKERAKKHGGKAAGAGTGAGGGAISAPTDDSSLAIFLIAVAVVLGVIAFAYFINRRNENQRADELADAARRVAPL